MNFIFQLFRPGLPAEQIEDPEQVKKLYRYWRIRTFLALHLGYCIFYVTRKNLTPAIHIFSEKLNIDIISLGIITGTFSISYGLGKFLSGFLSDKVSARALMATGLLLSSIINLFYGFLTSFWLLVLFWGLNGLCQSAGYPPVAKSLVAWFSPRECAKVWSWWNSSHAMGTFLAGGIIALLLKYCGDWHAIFYVPGIIGIITACYIFWSLRDSPQVVGLPPVEEFKKETLLRASSHVKANRWFIIKKYVLYNPYIWSLCLALCCMDMVQYSVSDWATKFLYEARGVSKVQAVWVWNIAPLLGLPGGLVAGYIVSRFCKGICGIVTLIYALLLAASVYGYILFAGASSLTLTCLLMGLVGFFVDGTTILINVMIMRITVHEATGTVAGFSSGMKSALGTALGAHFGSVYIVAHYGWNVLYYICILVVMIAMLLISLCMKKEYSCAR